MAAAKRLIPLLDRVLVEKIVAPTKSIGGVLLPESAVSKAGLECHHGMPHCGGASLGVRPRGGDAPMTGPGRRPPRHPPATTG